MRPFQLTLAAVAATTALLAGCSGDEPDEGPAESFTPTARDQDPSTRIEGVLVAPPQTSVHIAAPEQVDYEQSPPIGGSHDEVWADCAGAVYDTAVRNEHMVHSLEHGAVWIAYDAERLSGDALDALAERVDGQPYTMLSPYPGLDAPISLQSWGHQLTLDDADDPRIDQFIAALRANQYQHPEPGAPCEIPPEFFDRDNPPPFED